MATEKLTAEFDLLKGNDTISGTLKNILSSVDNVSSSFFKLTSVIAVSVAAYKTLSAAAGTVVDFLQDSVEEASQAEQGINRLATALRLAGRFSNEAVDDLTEFASSLQSVTTFSDDQIISVSTLIETIARLSGTELKRATKAALDLSTALGVDLDTAARLVGKAAEGNITSFKKLGVTIQEGRTNAETFSNTLKALEGRFGGSALSSVNTYDGALLSLKNTFSDFQEVVGGVIVRSPSLIALFNNIKKQIIDFTATLQKNIGQTDFLQPILLNILEFGKSFSSVVIRISEQLLSLAKASIAGIKLLFAEASSSILEGVSDISDKLEKVIGANKFSSTIKGLRVVLSRDVNNLVKESNDVFENFLNPQVSGQITKSLDKMIGAVKNTNGKLKDAGKDLGQNFTENFEEEIAKTDWQKLIKGFNDVGRDGFVATIQAVIKSTDLAPFIKAGAGILQGLLDGSKGFVKSVVSAAGTIATAIVGPLGGVVAETINSLIEFFGIAPQIFIDKLISAAAGIPQLIANVLINAANLFAGTFIDQMVVQFINNVPLIVEALTRAIVVNLASPAFWLNVAAAAIGAFIANIPEMVQGFIDGFRNGVQEAVNLFKVGIVRSAAEFSLSIIKGAGDFVAELIRKIPGVGGLLGGGGGGGGGILGDVVGAITNPINTIRKVFKFAEGGIPQVKGVPNGFPNDRFPASLTSGELVVDTSTTQKLKNFLNNGNNAEIVSQLEINNSLMAKLIQELKRPMTTEANIVIGQEAIANVILNLNRSNQRLV